MNRKKKKKSNEKNNEQSALKIYIRLLKFSKQYINWFIIGIVATIFVALADSSLAGMIKFVIDDGLIAKNKKFVMILPILILSIFLIRGISLFLSNYFIAKVGRSVVADFRKKIFEHLVYLPANFYDRTHSGRIMSMIIYNTEQVASANTDSLTTILQEGGLLVGLVVVMFCMDWRISSIFFVAIPFIVAITKYTAKILRNYTMLVQKSISSVSHIAEEFLGGYKIVKTFNGMEYEIAKFSDASIENRNRELKVVKTNSISSSIVQIFISIPLVFTIYLVASSSLKISVGSFTAILAAMIRLLVPMRRVTRVNSEIQKGISAAKSVFDLLDEEKEKDIGVQHIEHSDGHIEYRNVSFCYPNKKANTIRNINIEIQPGQLVALVGRSGGGKSTIMNLLLRLHDISNGEILLDGISVKDIAISNLRKQFSLVSQNVVLFSDTIINNIKYGYDSDISEETLNNIKEIAHLNFIDQMNNGWNTQVGESGTLLSAGQKQRISIARAVLKNAPILLLDEATSSLDSESESVIQDSIMKLMKGRTTIVIAHRLSTVEKADQILVIDKGEIIERGTHEELLINSSTYSKLIKIGIGNNRQ